MSIKNLPASLEVSAENIRQIVLQSEALATEAIEKALEAGRLLSEAKSQVEHGQWLPFLERAGVPERKAQRLMRLHAAGLDSDTVTDLGGQKAALEWLSLRSLPRKGEGLSITPHSQQGNPFMSFEACFIWPSVQHKDHFYVSHIWEKEDGGCSAVTTKRPLLGKNLPADMDFNPVWLAVEKMMIVPKHEWHFHKATGAAVCVVADGLGITDALRQIADDAAADGSRVDAMGLEEAYNDLNSSRHHPSQDAATAETLANIERLLSQLPAEQRSFVLAELNAA